MAKSPCVNVVSMNCHSLKSGHGGAGSPSLQGQPKGQILKLENLFLRATPVPASFLAP